MMMRAMEENEADMGWVGGGCNFKQCPEKALQERKGGF